MTTQEDFTKSGRSYDLIFVANGYLSIQGYRRALSPNGICVVAGGSMTQFFQAILLGPLISKTGSKKTVTFIAQLNNADLVLMKELLEAGKVVPVIDRRYPLSEVAEPIRYVEEGHASGKVVVTLGGTTLIRSVKEHGLRRLDVLSLVIGVSASFFIKERTSER